MSVVKLFAEWVAISILIVAAAATWWVAIPATLALAFGP